MGRVDPVAHSKQERIRTSPSAVHVGYKTDEKAGEEKNGDVSGAPPARVLRCARLGLRSARGPAPRPPRNGSKSFRRRLASREPFMDRVRCGDPFLFIVALSGTIPPPV